MLVVMDGVGLREESRGNAFRRAETPNLDSLMDEGYEQLEASGHAVGLPEGYTGNSEVGHLHMGAGRRVPQRLSRINDAIESDRLREKRALKEALERAESRGKAVHLAGIVSDGGIHGHIDHLMALLDICSEHELEQVWVHCFTDGRDVPPKSAAEFLEKVERKCEEIPVEAAIATVTGRYFAMDRDSNWGRTQRAYRAMAEAQGLGFDHFSEALEECYADGEYDYFVQPSVSRKYPGMTPDDELIFYNFRADRERQIADAFLLEGFEEFENPVRPNFTSMFLYRHEFDNPVLFKKMTVGYTLGEKIADSGLSQLRVAESQKRPHVTYFFNGQRELEFEGEERFFIESDKIKSYDMKPEMHARETTDRVIQAVEEGEHDFIMLNYANPDLVGHTGEMEAAVEAVETVDRNVGRLMEAVRDSEYGMIVTADHGNCEDMGTEESPNTSHTTNPVPVIGVDLDLEVDHGELWEIHRMISRTLELD